MSPEDWKQAGEAIGYLLVGATAVIGTQRLHSKINPASSAKDENSGSLILLVERIDRNVKQLRDDISGVKADVREVKTDVELLADESKRHDAALHRLTNGFRDVDGRVAALESRIVKPM